MLSTRRSTVPDVSGESPDAIRKSVDLPQPAGPTPEMNSPRRSDNDASRPASVPSGNTLPAVRNESTSSPLATPAAKASATGASAPTYLLGPATNTALA